LYIIQHAKLQEAETKANINETNFGFEGEKSQSYSGALKTKVGNQ